MSPPCRWVPSTPNVRTSCHKTTVTSHSAQLRHVTAPSPKRTERRSLQNHTSSHLYYYIYIHTLPHTSLAQTERHSLQHHTLRLHRAHLQHVAAASLPPHLAGGLQQRGQMGAAEGTAEGSEGGRGGGCSCEEELEAAMQCMQVRGDPCAFSSGPAQ